jgi:signal transduction histidine kinase
VKDEFLSLISHELRTPITTIYGNARLLRDKWNRLSDDTREQAARDTAEESERLHRIVENLLLLTQLESGQSPELEPIHLPRLVARWIEAFRRREPSRRVELYVEGHVSPAIGVPTYVELACDNLLGNAHKYSPGDASITVIVREEDEAAQVLVRDSGPGIDPAEVDQLFSPFYRSRRTGSGAKGIGIGLAVSRRVIEAQGGTIWARPLSRAGSEFGFSLMLAENEHEDSPERKAG